jgi:hypothetical protein
MLISPSRKCLRTMLREERFSSALVAGSSDSEDGGALPEGEEVVDRGVEGEEEKRK